MNNLLRTLCYFISIKMESQTTYVFPILTNMDDTSSDYNQLIDLSWNLCFKRISESEKYNSLVIAKNEVIFNETIFKKFLNCLFVEKKSERELYLCKHMLNNFDVYKTFCICNSAIKETKKQEFLENKAISKRYKTFRTHMQQFESLPTIKMKLVIFHILWKIIFCLKLLKKTDIDNIKDIFFVFYNVEDPQDNLINMHLEIFKKVDIKIVYFSLFIFNGFGEAKRAPPLHIYLNKININISKFFLRYQKEDDKMDVRKVILYDLFAYQPLLFIGSDKITKKNNIDETTKIYHNFYISQIFFSNYIKAPLSVFDPFLIDAETNKKIKKFGFLFQNNANMFKIKSLNNHNYNAAIKGDRLEEKCTYNEELHIHIIGNVCKGLASSDPMLMNAEFHNKLLDNIIEQFLNKKWKLQMNRNHLLHFIIRTENPQLNSFDYMATIFIMIYLEICIIIDNIGYQLNDTATSIFSGIYKTFNDIEIKFKIKETSKNFYKTLYLIIVDKIIVVDHINKVVNFFNYQIECNQVNINIIDLLDVKLVETQYDVIKKIYENVVSIILKKLYISDGPLSGYYKYLHLSFILNTPKCLQFNTKIYNHQTNIYFIDMEFFGIVNKVLSNMNADANKVTCILYNLYVNNILYNSKDKKEFLINLTIEISQLLIKYNEALYEFTRKNKIEIILKPFLLIKFIYIRKLDFDQHIDLSFLFDINICDLSLLKSFFEKMKNLTIEISPFFIQIENEIIKMDVKHELYLFKLVKTINDFT